MIPGATDTDENIRGIGDFIKENMQGAVERWELCSFNNLCRDKYTRLGMDWPFADTELPERSLMEELAKIARGTVSPLIVCWSGSTKREQNANNKLSEKQNVSISGY